MGRLICVGIVVCASLVAGAEEPAGPAEAIRALTGAHTRVVWAQAAGKARRLVGIDTDDGRGERIILDRLEECEKPLITPRGDRVVYTCKGETFVIDWNGSEVRKVVKGYAVEVWADPRTGTEWVYVQTGKAKEGPIERFVLDKPGKGELVWNLTAVDAGSSGGFQLSADGTRAAGLLPWPNAGVARLPNQGWEKFGDGCWTSMAPDDSGLCWVFDGPHRNVYLQRAGQSLKVDIHRAPGIDGWEVYYPRWSNHVRFMTMTGPYTRGPMGGNNIRTGGPDVEVYIGRFNGEFTAIEEWVRVSHNGEEDFYGDAWIAGGERASAREVIRQAEHKALAGVYRPKEKLAAWPGDHRDLIFLWGTAGQTNQIDDPAGPVRRACNAEPRGLARYGRFGQMDLAGGAFLAQGADQAMLDACRKSSQLTVEAVLTPDNITQSGPARIVTFSRDTGLRNFTLGQDGGKLIFRLRTTATDLNGSSRQTELCQVQAGRTYHVIVAFMPGRLYCFVNGEPAINGMAMPGDLGNWEPMHLLFGDEFSGERDWAGQLEGLAVYSRLVTPEEARQKYALYQAMLDRRSPADRVVVEARLTGVSAVPDPKSLAQYRRCLVVYAYRVQEVISGKLEDKDIAVAHWGILDLQAQPGVRDRKVGRTYTLTIEPFDQHPQLQGERRVEEIEDLTAPLFYDVGR